MINPFLLLLFLQAPQVSSFVFRQTPCTPNVCLERTVPLLANTVKETPEIQEKRTQKAPPTARSVAVSAIVNSWNKRKAANNIMDRLEQLPSFADLSIRDRAFCRLLVTTVERRQGQINDVLAVCVNRPQQSRPGKQEQLVRATLQMGIAQLLFLDVPQYAAVKETVDTLRSGPKNKPSVPSSSIGFCNAVLRRVTREKDDLLTRHADLTRNAAPWLVQELRSCWGEDALHTIIGSFMEESPRVLTVHVGRAAEIHVRDDGNRTETTSSGIFAAAEWQSIERVASHFEEAEILPQGSIRVRHTGPLSSWPLFEEGLWWCQDISATLPALALRTVLMDATPHVIDMCAAPGGKTAQLESYGWNVTAVEVSSRRCTRLRQNRDRLGATWDVVVADGTQWIPERLAGAVLLDAPCTATGTGSKRPDVLWKEDDFGDLLELQQQLAQHAVDHLVKNSGVLVYATCSLLKRESEDQVHKLLEANKGSLETLPFQPGEIPGFDQAITDEGWIRVLPGLLTEVKPCDGFFVARLRRVP